MTKRRISKDKYDELLRELGVIHKIGKYGSLLKDGDGNFDVLACISSETIALEYILGDMDIPDYHMEYLKESLKQRKKIHKTLLNGKFRPHEDEMELLEDYKRALGIYLILFICATSLLFLMLPLILVVTFLIPLMTFPYVSVTYDYATVFLSPMYLTDTYLGYMVSPFCSVCNPVLYPLPL